MPSRNAYRYKAVKTTVYGHKKIGHQKDGVQYDSILEARMARVLLANEVCFTPHVKFALVRPDGQPFDYTVDFLLHQPLDIAGVPGFVNAIEVKGVLSKKDIKRMKALEYCTPYRGWIAGEMFIKFWETEGLF